MKSNTLKGLMAKKKYQALIGNKNAAVPNPRTHKLTVRLTRDEHARVAAAAAAHKLPTAEHARNILLQF